MLCVKIWLSLTITLLAHFELVVSSPLVSLSDIGSNDHGEKEVGGREMKELKIKKEKTEKKGKSIKKKVSKVKKSKELSSKSEVVESFSKPEVVCPEESDRQLDMLGYYIDSDNLVKKFRSNLGNIANGANFMKGLNIPKITDPMLMGKKSSRFLDNIHIPFTKTETMTDVSSPSIRRTLEQNTVDCGLCNGESAPSPSTDVSYWIALYGWQERLEEFELGETCRDVEMLLSKWMICSLPVPERDSFFENYLMPFALMCGCDTPYDVTFCPDGKPVTNPDKDITDIVMLMASLENDEDDVDENYNDENDENEMETFLQDLNSIVGGTTCKDLEILSLFDENVNGTDYSIFTLFCGCEGVQSCAKNLCPYGNELPFPEKMLSGIGGLPETTTCGEVRESVSYFPHSDDPDGCSAEVRSIARYCECPCMGGKLCSICGNLVLRPDIIPPTSNSLPDFAGYTCGELDQLAQSSITEDSEDCNVGKAAYTLFCCE